MISFGFLVWLEEWSCGYENLRENGPLPSGHFMKSASSWFSPPPEGSSMG